MFDAANAGTTVQSQADQDCTGDAGGGGDCGCERDPVADGAAQYPRGMGMGTRVAAIVSLVLANLACGTSQSTTYWTVSEAESIRLVRGTALESTTCSGVGKQRGSAYRKFSCVGVVVPESFPDLPVRVRYVLNTRGKYQGQRSAYLATNVHFDSFGVP